jgi:diguanylate cyclase (GGDEF)-like protein/PAS domain S-box-containing protein
MYFNTLKFYILSDDDELEKLFAACEPPEDCGFKFLTLEDSSDLGALPPDSAVIADGIERLDDTLLAYGRNLIVIDYASRFEDADELVMFRADGIWALPDGSRSETMLITYFNILARRMKTAADYRKMTICLNTAIDSIPDLAWFKDEIGAHLIVNESFCRTVEKSKQQIYKRGHYYIWDMPKEEYDQGEYVCLESEDVVMEARTTCLFDERIKTKSGMRLFKTYKSPLIDTDGRIFGTCGIAHDVTDIQNVSSEMDVLLESMPFAIIIQDARGMIISANKQFETYFGRAQNILGMNFHLWKDEYLSGRMINVGGREELRVDVHGEERVLVYGEEPLIDVFHEKMGGICIFRDVTIERHFERQTIESANTDFLTGLDNRRSLSARLDELKQSELLTVITFDLDNFKDVNDTYGHHVGDEALVLTARTLRSSFPGDLVVRLGGDEFLVAECDGTPVSGIKQRVEHVLANLARAFRGHEMFSGLSISAGIASATKGNGFDFEALMRQSDSALYSAKNNGKNCVCLYGEETDSWDDLEDLDDDF